MVRAICGAWRSLSGLSHDDDVKTKQREPRDRAQDPIDPQKESSEERIPRQEAQQAQVVREASKDICEDSIALHLRDSKASLLAERDDPLLREALVSDVEVFALLIEHPAREADQGVVITRFTHNQAPARAERGAAVRQEPDMIPRVMEAALTKHDVKARRLEGEPLSISRNEPSSRNIFL